MMRQLHGQPRQILQLPPLTMADGEQHIAPALGAVLGFDLDGPTAPPEPWRSEHLAPCLTPACWRVVMCANRAGKAWALQTAKQFTARIALDRQHASIQRSVAAVLDAIATRGDKPSHVAILHRGSNDQHVISTLQALQPVAQHITSLDLHNATTAILTAAATALPHLTKLHVHTLHEAMPSPGFDSLTDLQVDLIAHTHCLPILQSIGRHLPQLTSLHVDIPANNMGLQPWRALLNDTTTSTTLQHFSYPDELHGFITPLLLHHLPNLQRLTVASTDMMHTQETATVGPWTLLGLTQGQLRYPDMALMPWPGTQQQLTIHLLAPPGLLWLDVGAQGAPRSLLECLQQASIHGVQQVELSFQSVPADQQPTALHTALQTILGQLQPQLPPDTPVLISDLHNATLEMSDVLTAAQQQWPQLGFQYPDDQDALRVCAAMQHVNRLHLTALEKEGLALLRQYPGCVQQLWVNSVVVGGPQPVVSPWPCGSLFVRWLDVEGLQYLGIPGPGASLGCDTLLLELHDKQAAHFLLNHLPTTNITAENVILRCPKVMSKQSQPELLTASLDILHTKVTGFRIVQVSWPLTMDAAMQLSQLPDVQGVQLQMWLKWGHDVEAYRQLGLHVPVCYRVWRVSGTLTPGGTPDPDMLVQLCLAAGEHRSEDHPLHLQLDHAPPERVAQFVTAMRAAGVPPHITVSGQVHALEEE